MNAPPENRFQEFYHEANYLALKNHLYNYLVRKRAVENAVQPQAGELVLEIGSGISPVMTRTGRIVYSDLSFEAMDCLRRASGQGWHVVADGTRLPFKNGAFQHAISSEVLEHVPDDRKAIGELARVLQPQGRLTVTFPHRKFYFAADDRFVSHCRRYELAEMEERLQAAGLAPVLTQKVLGPLEKVTAFTVVMLFSLSRKCGFSGNQHGPSRTLIRFVSPLFKAANRLYAGLAWLDARIMPRALATVLLIQADKR